MESKIDAVRKTGWVLSSAEDPLEPSEHCDVIALFKDLLCLIGKWTEFVGKVVGRPVVAKGVHVEQNDFPWRPEVLVAPVGGDLFKVGHTAEDHAPKEGPLIAAIAL
jgi:hypothetical protein